MAVRYISKYYNNLEVDEGILQNLVDELLIMGGVDLLNWNNYGYTKEDCQSFSDAIIKAIQKGLIPRGGPEESLALFLFSLTKCWKSGPRQNIDG